MRASRRGSATQELLFMVTVYIIAVGSLGSFMSMQHRQYSAHADYERAAVTGRQLKTAIDRLSGHNGTVSMRIPCNPNETVSIESVTTGKFILMIGEEEITRSVLRVHPSPNSTINFQQHYALIRFDLSNEMAERMKEVTCGLGFQPNPNPPDGGGCTQFLDELLHIFLEGELYRSIYICEELHCKAATTLTIHVTSDDDDVLRNDFNKIKSILEMEGKELRITVTNKRGQDIILSSNKGSLQDMSLSPATCTTARFQTLCVSSYDGRCP